MRGMRADLQAELNDRPIGAPRAPSLQASLCQAFDARKLRGLQERWRAREAVEDLRRLDDLRDPHQEHGWMYSLNPAVGRVMPPDRWVTAMRLRLGCPFAASDMICLSSGRRTS